MEINEKHLEEHEESSINYFPIILGVLGFAIFPALLLFSLIYVILFKLAKWKPQFNSIILGILLLLSIIISIPFNPYDLSNYYSSYIFLCIYLGILFGWGFILYRAYLLKKNPELTVVRGWAYNFKYKKSPLAKLKKNILKRKLSNGELLSMEAAPMGVLDDKVVLTSSENYDDESVVYRYYEEAFKTTLIFGATGSGKTITMESLMHNDIQAGFPVCCIDFKKGHEFVYFLSKWAKENGREFYHFTSGPVGGYNNPYCSEQASYDPLSTGTATSKADMMLNLRKWDGASDVYKNRTQAVLQSIFFLLEKVDRVKVKSIPWEEGGLAQFVAALQTPNLFDMIEWYKNDLLTRQPSAGDMRRLRELEAFYKDITSGRESILKEQMEGLGILCRNLVMSSYSDWLAKGETSKHIDLTEIVMSPDAPVVLFQFNPLEEPEFAKYMGNIIMADLARASAIKNNSKNKTPFGLYVDEFQTLDPMTVAGLAEKARSAKFFTTLSLQSAEQISKSAEKNGEETLKSFFDTVGNFIVHDGSTLDSSERLSKILGMYNVEVYKATGKRHSGIMSWNLKNSRHNMVNTSVEEQYKVKPKDFMELSSPTSKNGYKSTAYYITKQSADPEFSEYSFAIGRKVHIIPPKEIIEPIPDEFTDNLYISPPQKRKNINKTQTVNTKHQNNNINNNIKLNKTNVDDSIFEDENFKIEEIEQPIKKSTLEDSSVKLLEQSMLSTKDFNSLNKRESLEKPKKKTSWDTIQENKKQLKRKTQPDKKGLPPL